MHWIGLVGGTGLVFTAVLLPLDGSAAAAVPEPSGAEQYPASGGEHSGWSDLAGFDLAARKAVASWRGPHLPSSGEKPAAGPGFEVAGRDFEHGRDADVTGPSWSYRPADGGPVVELAALAAGKAGRPGLVHLAIDWDF